MFKLRSKVETYGVSVRDNILLKLIKINKCFSKKTFQDMTKNKLTVQAATPINYKEYNQYLINNYKELTGY